MRNFRLLRRERRFTYDLASVSAPVIGGLGFHVGSPSVGRPRDRLLVRLASCVEAVCATKRRAFSLGAQGSSPDREPFLHESSLRSGISGLQRHWAWVCSVIALSSRRGRRCPRNRTHMSPDGFTAVGLPNEIAVRLSDGGATSSGADAGRDPQEPADAARRGRWEPEGGRTGAARRRDLDSNRALPIWATGRPAES
jgi:hypothetical protein